MLDSLDTLLTRWSKYLDAELLTVVLLLLGFGLVMMTSASVATGDRLFGDESYFMVRQLMFIGMGLVIAIFVFQVPMKFWQNVGVAFLPIIIILLLAVLIPSIGKQVNGSRRWINLGFASIQVSEVAKLIIFMYLASYMVRHGDRLKSDAYKPLLMPLLVLGVIGGLLLLEPDFGTVVVVFATGLAMLFLGGVKLSRLALLLLSTIVVMVPFLMMGYRGRRIISFLDPWKDSTGIGYQVTNALMAIGDGGWLGSGLGGSVQKQFYLPEAHNDFIFAVLADEFGFVGIVITLFLYAWLVKRAFTIGLNADKKKQYFGAYVAYAIGFWMGFQSLFHMGVNLAILPPKGLTLPFMSYGGSSLLVTIVAMAILMRIHREAVVGTVKKKVTRAKGKQAVKTRPARKAVKKTGAIHV